MENYTNFELIAKGGFSSCYKCICILDNKTYCMKKINDNTIFNDFLKFFRQEVKNLKKISYEYIIKYYNSFIIENTYFIILEYFEGEELLNYSNNNQLSLYDNKQIFLKIVEACNYLHSNNIIHRDLKLENILINKNRDIKLIDFGFSHKIDKEKKINEIVGTEGYMSLECKYRTSYYDIYDDMWTLGIILFLLVEGDFPNDYYNYNFIKNDTPEEYKMLIKSLLIKKKYRIDTNVILQNKWLIE